MGSTVEQQPVGKFVQQSFGEAPRAESSKPTESKHNPIGVRSENTEDTERVLVDEENTSRSQEIDGKRLQEELGSSDRTRKPVKSEDNRVMHADDTTREPVKSSAKTVEEFGSAEHRDTASSNANKFNLATNEENVDFNNPSVQNSTVKRSHGINVHNLIQQIENHPQREALQNDLHQHRAFNLFSEESKSAIKAAGNTELCEIVDVEPKSQCRACLTYWNVRIVYCTCGHFYKMRQLKTRSTSRPCWFLYPELLHQEGPATRSQVREERRLQRTPHGKSTSKKVAKETPRKHSRSIYS